MWYKTQDEYDELVLTFLDYEVKLVNRAALLRRSNDSDFFRVEEETMALQNILYSLSYYDITAGILTDDEIYYNFELATDIIQNAQQKNHSLL